MELKLWDLATGTLRTAESKIAGTVGRVQFSNDGKLLAFEYPSRDGSTEMVGLWDVTIENGQPVWRERRQFVFKGQ